MTTTPIITGKVIHGEKVGRTIGFPTANLDVQLTEAELAPGVYLARVVIVHDSLAEYDGLAYFGPRHIFGEQVNSFEVYLYDFSSDLYDLTLAVTLTDFIREPLPLDTVDKLSKQLRHDKQVGLELITQKAVY